MLKKRSTVWALALMVSLLVATSAAYADSADISGADYYTGTATGYGGSIRISIGVIDGEMVDIQAEGRGETAGIGTPAVEQMPEAMLEAQTWDVDGITGATLTSDGVREAAKKAMISAGLIEDDPEPEPEPVVESEPDVEPEVEPEPEEATPPPSTADSEQSGGSSTLLIVVAVAAVAVVAFILIAKNKKK